MLHPTLFVVIWVFFFCLGKQALQVKQQDTNDELEGGSLRPLYSYIASPKPLTNRPHFAFYFRKQRIKREENN